MSDSCSSRLSIYFVKALSKNSLLISHDITTIEISLYVRQNLLRQMFTESWWNGDNCTPAPAY